MNFFCKSIYLISIKRICSIFLQFISNKTNYFHLKNMECS